LLAIHPKTSFQPPMSTDGHGFSVLRPRQLRPWFNQAFIIESGFNSCARGKCVSAYSMM
jgi:hypothetical protein